MSARLVINLSARAEEDLALAVAFDGNRTLAVNRALRLYALVLQAQREGKPIFIGNTEVTFL